MLGNILRYIRICNNFSAKKTAEIVGVSAAFISEVENNKKKVSLDTLNKFSSCYNIETYRILYFDELEQAGVGRKEIMKEILEYYIEKEEINNILYKDSDGKTENNQKGYKKIIKD